MNRDSCLAALETYRTIVQRIAGSLANVEPPLLAGGARVLVDDLEFRVQVDLASRSANAGAEHMTEIEATLFAPALKLLQSTIATKLVGRDSLQWLPALVVMEATLRDAASRARVWVAEAD